MHGEARKFEKNFWDGQESMDGGYKYITGYWTPVQKK